MPLVARDFSRRALLPLALAALSVPARAQTQPDPVMPMAGQNLRWFASTDPQHQNKDYVVLQPNETRRIPLAAGTLVRLWSTALVPEEISLSLQSGVSAIPLWQNGRAVQGVLHEKAYAFYPTRLVLRANAMLVATNNAPVPNKWFYQATVQGAGASYSLVASTGVTARSDSHGMATLAPNSEAVVSTITSTGLLTRLTFAPETPELAVWRAVHLRLYWDGKTTPDVDVPLSVFAARFSGNDPVTPVQNAVTTFDGKSLVLNWPMPFENGARIALFNSATSPVDVDWTVQSKGMGDVGGSRVPFLSRFHAAYGSARTQRGQPIPILKATGTGAFCGLALDIRPAPDGTSRTFAFLEGNETLTADGVAHEGTGTEDFFNSAWYFPDRLYSQPYAGLTFKSAAPPHVAMYRWMIPDAVSFKNSFAFDFEHDSGNNRADLEYRWAAFWYQGPNGTATVADTLTEDEGAGASVVPGSTPVAGSPVVPGESGTARSDWKFFAVIFGVFMAAIAAFFIHRHTRRKR